MSIVDHETSEISMRVKLSRKAKEKLTSLAAEHGRGIDEYASELLEQAVTRPNLDELLAPLRADLANSGMSEQEIMELGRRELAMMRGEQSVHRDADELLAPFRKQVAESGMSDDELDDFFRAELEAVRREKSKAGASATLKQR